ncbi:AraC family transcriptional regulator [Aquimarina sp. ERC-38]|uniref:helix-turn-helix domain-containing protein n=1 Tax=Aquimarina sp. ERC-38 TaxID=2949996 RepID=UPI0022451A7F|nr:AraC family transcriptional regulator [Aquimarina sp. ERC-38]UZO81940.1 AraC family transcriptional regulator [Aquimarina sp. ERC-38]
MVSFTFIDILLAIGISQGLFLIIGLQLIKNRNKKINGILSALLLIAMIMLTGRMIYGRFESLWIFRVASYIDVVIFLFGPLLYLFVRKLLFIQNKEHGLSWYHFIPATIHLTAFTFLLFPSEAVLRSYGERGIFTWAYFLVESIGIILNTVYVLKSFHLINTYQTKAVQSVSFAQEGVGFVKLILIAVSSSLVLWCISCVNSYFLQNTQLSFISYKLIWISIPVFIYITGFYNLWQPELFRIQPVQKQKVNYPDRLTKEQLISLTQRLEQLMEVDKVYLENTLTLKDLAVRLQTSSNNISWLLNNHYEKSFYEFVNTYRVKEFIHKIEKGEHQTHTLLALSLDSGFNSKSTFNKVFKQVVQETPSAFVKNRTSISG